MNWWNISCIIWIAYCRWYYRIELVEALTCKCAGALQQNQLQQALASVSDQISKIECNNHWQMCNNDWENLVATISGKWARENSIKSITTTTGIYERSKWAVLIVTPLANVP